MRIIPKNKECRECHNDDQPLFADGKCKKCAGKVYTKKAIDNKKASGKRYALKRTRLKKTNKNTKSKINADNKFYNLVWDSRPHICEECGRWLGDELNKGFISHILAKGSHPEMRHDLRNANVLCLVPCHQTWEFGDKKNMKIWKNNQEIIKLLKQEYAELSK